MVRSVVVLGKGSLSVHIAQYFLDSEEYELLGVIPSTPTQPVFRSLEDWAISRRVAVINSLDALADQSIDLGFSCFYNRILRSNEIGIFRLLLNLHNSPLPKYRGVLPVNWALRNGEQSHGVTIHQISPGIDDGPIYAQEKFSIDPDSEEVLDVYLRCLENGKMLFQRTIPLVWKVQPRDQDLAQASYYSVADAERLGDRREFFRDERPVPANLVGFL